MEASSPNSASVAGRDDGGEFSLLEVVTVMLRRRRMIMLSAFVAGLMGLTIGLASRRVYKSTALFIPQTSEAGASGLLSAASQLGVRIPPTAANWGPPIYVAVLQSRALLEPIILDTMVVAEEGNRRVPVLEILHREDSDPRELAIEDLGELLTVREVKTLGAVEIAAKTRWPSVSRALVDKLVKGLNEFNVATRQSQAAAERRFVEEQAVAAESALRSAEDRLQSFLERNRALFLPQLQMQRDRLQREVQLRQQLYTSLMQNREEARIREVRDTPVITLLEIPVLATMGEARRSVQKALLGAVVGFLFGIVTVFVTVSMSRARRRSDATSEEFFQLVQESTPGFLRRLFRRLPSSS